MSIPYEQLLLDSLDKRFQDQRLQELESSRPASARVWLLGVHERANIGDMALTYTAEVFLRRLFPKLEHVTISRSVATHNWQRLKPLIQPDDLIFLPGGGNLGDIWLHEEHFRRLIVKSFPANRIVSLPQSVLFSDPSQEQISKELYSEHERLLMFARDEQSLERLKRITKPGGAIWAPDMALSYEYPVPFLPQDKSQVLVIARNDKEEGDFSLRNWLLQSVEVGDFSYRGADTVYPDLEFHGSAFSAKSVYKKIDECHSSGVVITNRLHGAIFSLLAGRPVVAYENSYGKIGGALRPLLERIPEYIRLETSEVSERTLSELAALPDLRTTPAELLKEDFQRLSTAIRSFVQGPTAKLVY